VPPLVTRLFAACAIRGFSAPDTGKKRLAQAPSPERPCATMLSGPCSRYVGPVSPGPAGSPLAARAVALQSIPPIREFRGAHGRSTCVSFPVLRVRGRASRSSETCKLRTPGPELRSRRQPMHGAPPLSQGRRWGCSQQHARRVCTCTAGRCGGVFACVRTLRFVGMCT